MKKLILIIAALLTLSVIKAHAQTTMICQTLSGQQFVWVGTTCPPGSIFVSY